jgi:hypothetical protein
MRALPAHDSWRPYHPTARRIKRCTRIAELIIPLLTARQETDTDIEHCGLKTAQRSKGGGHGGWLTALTGSAREDYFKSFEGERFARPHPPQSPYS